MGWRHPASNRASFVHLYGSHLRLQMLEKVPIGTEIGEHGLDQRLVGLRDETGQERSLATAGASEAVSSLCHP
ncbi:MAG: hypothetical protein HY685_07000 [Chloroflexi bacterium]|nr:hypothetical protein [Chloroflexota bacterium]